MKWRGYLTPVTENYLHAYGVGYISYVLARKFHVDSVKAFVTGTLHDLGGAVPADERVTVAESIGVSLNDEEREVPLLVHAKLGKYFAQTLFDITDEDMLNAILFHTTCIDRASDLVKIVFLADKIRWDRNGTPPYLNGLLAALEISLDDGCSYFLKWLWNSDLYIVHPYLSRSYGAYVRQQQYNPISLQDFSVLQGNLNENLVKKYYLHDIYQEFHRTFYHAHLASVLASKHSVNTEEAYVTSALVNMTNTIKDDELETIASVLNLNVQVPIRPQLTSILARDEYGITSLEMLKTLKSFPQIPSNHNSLLWVVAMSWICQKSIKCEVEDE